MFDTTISLGSVIAAASVMVTWYLNTKKFRREDKLRREQQHQENAARLANIERHLGGPHEKPLVQRVERIEAKVEHLEKRICE